jgi:hypothetical protein
MARMMSPKKMAAPAVVAQAAPKRKRSAARKSPKKSPKKAKRSTRKVIKTSRKFKSMLL